MSRHPSLHTEVDESFRALTRIAALARGHVLAGRYVIGAELGRGAVGRVFRAFDRATRTRVALKVVHPEVVGRRSALARFGREVRHAREVSHPNVCRVFELVESEGFTFFTMELARGPLRAGRPARRPLADRLADARAAAAGLSAIHAAGLVHRDLKPENLLRMSDGRLVVSDFGLARPASRGRAGVAGTIGYMAPEVRKGRPATPRSDVWSLGVVLQQILFGGPAEPAKTGSGLEAALAALCQACTAPVPARRPRGAAAVLARLDELDGETLRERLRRGRVPLVSSLAIGVQVLESLAVLHRRGRAHGAVAPENLFLPRADGPVRLLHPKTDAPLATAELGPVYRHERGDARADIAAAGWVLVECLGGRVAGRRPEAPDRALARVPAAARPLLHRMLTGRASGPGEAGALALELAALHESLPARPGRRAAEVLSAEQRIASVVAVKLGEGRGNKELARAVETAESFGATVARVDARSFAATLGTGTPLDLASAAARCAVALRASAPEGRFAVTTGQSSGGAAGTACEAAERALALVRGGTAGGIRLDATSAALLSARFRVGDGPVLLGDRSLLDRPRTVLGKEIPCVGRDRELSTLMGLWDECVAEPVARASLVTAPAGTGKSRLFHELLDAIQSGGQAFQMLLGRGDALRAGASFAMLGAALRGAAGLAGGEPPEQQQRSLLARVGRHLPDDQAPRVAAFLGEIADVHFPDDQLPALRAARKDPRLMADQTLAAWLDFLEAESRVHPVLLVLEDLHWGDAPSVQLVDAALRTLGQRPLLVLAFARPEVDDRFGNLWVERDLQRISLPPLTPRSAQRLVQLAVADLPAEQAARVVERAGGNPFFLEELIRAVAAEGGSHQIPETVVGTVQARFDVVGADAKRVLRAGAIFGQSFRAAGVRQLLGGDPDPSLEQWLDLLVRNEILFDRPVAEDREFVFRHALLQEAAYHMLTAEDRVRGHRLAGEFLEAGGAREAIVLVEHYERGGEWPRAVQWCRLAAEQALDATDLGEAIRRVERGVRLGAQGEALASLRLVEAQSRFWRGECTEAAVAARASMEAASGPMRFLAASELVGALGHQAHFADVARVLEELAVSPPPGAEERAWLGCQLRGAAYLLVAGRYQPSADLVERIEQRRAVLDDIQELRLLSLQGQMALHHGHQAAAVSAFQRALEKAQSVGEQRVATEMLANLGVCLLDMGVLEESERTSTAALAAADRMGMPSLSACVLVNLSSAQGYLGRTAEAVRSAERSRALARQHGDCRVEGGSEIRLAMLALGENPEAAEVHARAAMKALRAVPPLFPAALAALARVLLAEGRVEEARASAGQAFDLLEQLGGVEDGEATIYLAHALCLLATNDRARARQVLVAGARRLEARAATIDRPEWRAAFLDRIPDHAEIIALHRAGA